MRRTVYARRFPDRLLAGVLDRRSGGSRGLSISMTSRWRRHDRSASSSLIRTLTRGGSTPASWRTSSARHSASERQRWYGMRRVAVAEGGERRRALRPRSSYSAWAMLVRGQAAKPAGLTERPFLVAFVPREGDRSISARSCLDTTGIPSRRIVCPPSAVDRATSRPGYRRASAAPGTDDRLVVAHRHS